MCLEISFVKFSPSSVVGLTETFIMLSNSQILSNLRVKRKTIDIERL